MDSDGSRYFYLVLLIIFTVLKCFYSACEYADIEVNDSKIKTATEKDKKYERLMRLLENPSRMLITFSAARTVFSILIAVLAVIFVSHDARGVKGAALSGVTVACVSVGITALTEMLPKKLVRSNIEAFAVNTVLPVKILMVVMSPFSALSYGVSAVFCFILRIPVSSAKDVVTEEEILMMVDAGNETGVIEESQREMINNIFEFGDSVVSEVMTHRTDLCAADVES